jgi:hypothetical protein
MQVALVYLDHKVLVVMLEAAVWAIQDQLGRLVLLDSMGLRAQQLDIRAV